jgi:hypothetical protein
MEYSLPITIIGTLASVIGALIALFQARSADKSSKNAQSAMIIVQLSAVAERLKLSQEHIRDIIPSKINRRGFKFEPKITLIQQEFDMALSTLPSRGAGSSSRELLSQAQNILNTYHASLSTAPNLENWQELQKLVQDTVSDLSSVNYNAENEND